MVAVTSVPAEGVRVVEDRGDFGVCHRLSACSAARSSSPPPRSGFSTCAPSSAHLGDAPSSRNR
jgi:hypothetical protein